MVEINFQPSRRDLRLFGVLLAVFLAVVAEWARRRGMPTGLVASLAGGAVVSGVLGFALPQALWPIYIGWMVAVFPIGWLVSHLVLLAVFLGIVAPLGWLLRRRGHDPMCRQFDRAAKTYWQTREARPDARRYFRPF